ncbi:MAG TPA: RDD family protein [Acidobacteriaceae bacterium]|nr:RDD family protein [Acidobacteriaceae bacterium]
MSTNGYFNASGAEASDQLTIETPEQVAIRFPIAGVGSRFLALLADILIQALAYAIIVLLLALLINTLLHSGTPVPGNNLSDNAAKWVIAGIILFVFLIYWGYFTLFEAFWNGQTPGKRFCKLRVIRDSGRQITLFESMTRNLVRVIDWFPGIYAVGVITMLCNKQNKRLGDFAAGTLVIHERAIESPLWSGSASRTITAAVFAPDPIAPPPIAPLSVDLPADAVARLTPDDLNVIDHFFVRAIDIDIARREQLADRLARQMTARMGTPMPEGVSPERVLESIARILRGIRR